MSRIDPVNKTWQANADCNSFTETGIYFLSTGTINGIGGAYGQLQVIAGRSDIINQIYRANGKTYEREYRSSSWSDWQELAINSKFPNITEIKIAWDSTINKPTLEVTGIDGHKHKFIGETIS